MNQITASGKNLQGPFEQQEIDRGSCFTVEIQLGRWNRAIQAAMIARAHTFCLGFMAESKVAMEASASLDPCGGAMMTTPVHLPTIAVSSCARHIQSFSSDDWPVNQPPKQSIQG